MVWGLFVCNPMLLSILVVLVGIPLAQWLPRIHRLTPNMLKRMGLGMFILVIQDLIYTLLAARPLLDENIHYDKSHNISPSYCFKMRVNPNSYDTVPADYFFLWLICPQILNGLAQLLVNMTALEFICAQAPRTMQGLLIGLWYAMFSIRYLLMCSLDHVFTSSLGMLIYQAVRTSLVLLSLILYLCVSRAYKYRIQDWVVHVQWMVEDIIGRRMDQEENYNRQLAEEQILFNNSLTSNDYGSCSQPE